MPFNGAGLYSPPAADFPAVANTLIESAHFNNVINDIATALSICITKDGQQTITANIPMNNFVFTGLGSGISSRTRSANIGDVQDGQAVYAGTAGGTADALTLTLAPAVTGRQLGRVIYFKSGAAPNTVAATLALNGLAPAAIQLNGAALIAGTIEASKYYGLFDDGVNFQLFPVSDAILKSIGTAKGDLIAFSASATSVRQGVGSDGQALHADSSQTSGLVYIDNPSRPNLLINPNWQIDQINEGGLYTVNAADVRGPDGWSGTAVGAGVFKLRTLADPDNAARKCMEISCTTADAAIAATDDYFIYSAIEGYDASEFYFGTAGAKTLTVQFKFKTNVTGVYGVSLANSAKNRSNYQIITVADTNEHEYTLSFTADTAGAWLYTNGVGLYLAICLSAGSNFQGAAGAWAADAKQTTSAQCNFMSVSTNIAYLKPIQVIPGALVQAYRAADFQKELAKAQRYYEKTFNQGTAVAQNAGFNTPGSLRGCVPIGDTLVSTANWRFSSTKRATPTVTTYNPAVANANWRNEGNTGDSTAGVAEAGTSGVDIDGAGGTAQNHYIINATADARLS